MRKLMHSKKGFTLVELMIVVVIMGILVAVAIPVYGAVTKNAAKKTCDSNIRIIKENLNNFQMTGGADGATMTWKELQKAVFKTENATSGKLSETNTSFTATFEGGKAPKCPKAGTNEEYSIDLGTQGTFTVKCGATDEDASGHEGYVAKS